MTEAIVLTAAFDIRIWAGFRFVGRVDDRRAPMVFVAVGIIVAGPLGFDLLPSENEFGTRATIAEVTLVLILFI